MPIKPFKDALTQAELKAVLNYDPDKGAFVWLYRTDRPAWWNTQHAGKVAGNHKGGYVNIGINGTYYSAHRLAFLYMTGNWPTDRVDHINGVEADNRWANLRVVTCAQNGANRKRDARNRTGVAGVTPYGEKFRATICVNKKVIHLGTFAKLDDAAAARQEAELEHFGEYRRRA